jgi:chlorobactene glucosyltransferase
MVYVLIFVSCILIGTAAIAIVNAFTFPRLKASVITDTPFVSILIPARDEARVIGETVRSLLRQTYPMFEVLLLDDQSSDGTGNVARAAAGDDTRLRIVSGQPLPNGWLGKNWACHQLAQAARGDVLIFTDADVRWADGALAALLAEMTANEVDMLTVWSTQTTVTWGERWVVPLMALVILAYLPAPLVHHSRSAAFAAANGQCLVFRRRVYDQIGGHEAVCDSIVEDIALARRVKTAGLRLRMVDGNGMITCRMYESWSQVRAGYAKNIIAGYGDSVALLGLATIFHWLVFLMPWGWLAMREYRLWALMLIVLGVLVRALTAQISRQRVLDALALPLSALLMTWIAGQAVWWRWRHGGPSWKGRRITVPVHLNVS